MEISLTKQVLCQKTNFEHETEHLSQLARGFVLKHFSRFSVGSRPTNQPDLFVASELVRSAQFDAVGLCGAMGKAWLEGFKFSVYLAVPVALTAAFAVNPENLEAVIRNVRARARRGDDDDDDIDVTRDVLSVTGWRTEG